MRNLIDSQHIAVSASANVLAICSDFFQKTGISYFTFARQFNDGSRFSLTTHPEQALYFYNSEYYRNIVFSKPEQKKTEYWLWNALPFSAALEDQAMRFDIANGFTIIQPQDQTTEYFYFGARTHEQFMNNFYINHLGLLHQFCAYFKEQARGLIATAAQAKNRIMLPADLIQQSTNHAAIDPIRQFHDRQVITVENISFNAIDGQITKREIECGLLLVKGATAKSIARDLDISPRTAEVHIQNLKTKLACHSKTQLIHKLNKLGFDKF